ncbi:MAG: sigma 54-interacting transcriptional regulator [Kofleriaceae bacterium]|nr:sigma 54-interacting transcriptional regulator [Kofleriaceae bacterium]MCB9574323.1 sigma 54-interacting transcriptional regulator [Kofleriaceae bacterium]
MVLDGALHIVAATPRAAELLGFEPPVGEPAAKVLCPPGTDRPIAEALAAGRPALAVLSFPAVGGGEDRRITVRATPLGPTEARGGWLLALEDAGEADAEGPVLFHRMWTQDTGMKRLFRIVEKVAREDVPVLVRGETGAGKELVAQAVHELSPRAAGPFRAINCAALPATLLESELFGHARGAFTGAVKDTVGHFESAHGGTLFLDEVGELPLEVQAKLLRVIETRTVLPVGGREPVPVDVRIVSATHRALRKEVEAGRFRADLMYRLRVIPVFLPALRERPGDVALLVHKLIDEANGRSRRRIEHVAPAALAALDAYDWPGNVRELRNALAYAYAIGDGPVLEVTDLPPEISGAERGAMAAAPTEGGGGGGGGGGAREPADEAGQLRALLERHGNRDRVAQVLGISRVTLWRRMKRLGLA